MRVWESALAMNQHCLLLCESKVGNSNGWRTWKEGGKESEQGGTSLQRHISTTRRHKPGGKTQPQQVGKALEPGAGATGWTKANSLFLSHAGRRQSHCQGRAHCLPASWLLGLLGKVENVELDWTPGGHSLQPSGAVKGEGVGQDHRQRLVAN